MKQLFQLFCPILLVASLGPIMGCSTTPKEVVELSYQIGEDLSSVHKSYKVLIHSYFEMLRQERISYLEEDWIPLYIRTWVEDGRLIEVARGDIVWSEEQEAFIKPINDKEEGLLTTICFWAQAAVSEIESKREDLLGPLNKQEDELSLWVDDEFNRLYRGNAAITAHLNSIRKVQEVNDNIFSALNVKDLRDKIDNALIDASDNAKKGLEAIRKADGLTEKVKTKLEKTEARLKH